MSMRMKASKKGMPGAEARPMPVHGIYHQLREDIASFEDRMMAGLLESAKEHKDDTGLPRKKLER